MKPFARLALLAVALAVGCSTTSRRSSHAGTTHITVSGTAGVVVTGFYVQDNRRIGISNATPWSLDVPRMSSLELRASPGSGEVMLDLRYEGDGVRAYARQLLGSGENGARVRVRNGFIVSTF